MSDSSFDFTSDGPGTTWAISQQHEELYNERKRERAEARQARHHNKRAKFGDRTTTKSPIKQESSPSTTPRLTAMKANELFAEYIFLIMLIVVLDICRQYAAALNSDMGENTFVDRIMQGARNVVPERSPCLDGTDIDLLRMQCVDAEAQRDDALEARDEALKSLAQMKVELDRAIGERDNILYELDEAMQERDDALTKLEK
ncbi:hypothetical protein B0H15DRAFT_807271 [Mycena belliarum]|uniref:Uncharacterized protein n=1 Tax=Mycena belliarum TaxID=1033014 RepID=A0AAD6XI02_9AGAR|nr:hypothetical protein B0H15DRAFT_807271 [Mycena belliae]